MKKMAIVSAILAGGFGFAAQSAVAAPPDWSKVPAAKIHVFHPGETPWQWVDSKGKHGGSRGLARGESCAGCHIEGGEINLDMVRIAKELETKGAPKTMTYPVSVQAAYDADNLYMRLTFKAPGGGFDHSDKANEVKATVLFPNDKIPMPDQVGCWATCHQDLKTMKDGSDKSKYVASGAYDLMQWASSGKVSDGSVTDKRAMEGGKAGVKAEGAKSGDTWTVTFTRKLNGGVALAPGKPVQFGIAVHADNAAGRFHHVSFGQTIGLGVDGDVKAAKQ